MHEIGHNPLNLQFSKSHKTRGHNVVNLLSISIFIIILFVDLPSTNAETRDIKIYNDNRKIIHFDIFRFTNRGHLKVNISSISITPDTNNDKPLNSTLIAFFMSPRHFLAKANNYTISYENSCVFTDKPFINPLFTMADISLKSQSINKKFEVMIPNRYFIYLINCNHPTYVSMELHLESYNLDANGNKNYLDDGFDQMPTIFSISSLVYFMFLIWWLSLYMERKSSRHKIHILMGGLLLIKSLDLLFLAENKYHVKVTGYAHGWDLLWCTFHFIRTLYFFVVVVLIGSGWSFLRPVLHEDGKKMLIFGIPIHVMSNLMYIAIWESDFSSDIYPLYIAGFIMLDLLCCGLVFVPLMKSIRSMKEKARIDGKAGVNLARLKRFRSFFIILLVYVIVSRYGILELRFRALEDVKFWWITIVTEQMCNILFYVAMFYTFRPIQHAGGYVVPNQNDEEAARAEIQRFYLLYLI